MTELDAEDAKLVTLARGAMGRAEAGSGAAVPDQGGPTYCGAPVDLEALKLTALQATVAACASFLRTPRSSSPTDRATWRDRRSWCSSRARIPFRLRLFRRQAEYG
mgnify:CR=1 FL=1